MSTRSRAHPWFTVDLLTRAVWGTSPADPVRDMQTAYSHLKSMVDVPPMCEHPGRRFFCMRGRGHAGDHWPQ